MAQPETIWSFLKTLKIEGGARDRDLRRNEDRQGNEDWRHVRKEPSDNSLHPSARWYLSKLVRK